jgi:hypothetical protein
LDYSDLAFASSIFIIIIINRLQTVRVYSRPQTFSIPCALDQVGLM